MCTQHPDFDANVIVTTPTPALAAVFAGADTWARAVASGVITVTAVPAYPKGMQRWFLWSAFTRG